MEMANYIAKDDSLLEALKEEKFRLEGVIKDSVEYHLDLDHEIIEIEMTNKLVKERRDG